LAVCLLINYIDRSNLSLAAPLLKEELHLSATQLGILFSAFFWTYTALQFVSGWLVDRFAVNRVIAVGFLLWSLATSVTGIVRGFATLFLVRLVLGSENPWRSPLTQESWRGIWRSITGASPMAFLLPRSDWAPQWAR
jgi:sugar phosphate permease